jgi:MFS transporter, ACS family, tartrate transporter
MILWGLSVIASSTISSFGWHIFFKLVLGATQAGYRTLIRFMPCIIVYIVSFYTKEESATRFTLVFGGASVAEVIFELLSNSASRADETMDVTGWQWVFVLEGFLVIFLGIVTLYRPFM